MQNDPPKPDFSSNSGNAGSSSRPPSVTGGQRVIHPTPEFVQEFQAQQPQQSVPGSQPTVPHNPTPQAPEYRGNDQINPASVYPTVAPRPVPVPGASPKPGQETVKPDKSQRVAARIPSLQIYAFLIIIYGIYSVVGLIGSRTSLFTFNPSLFILVFGIAGINLAIGTYLLVSKKIRTVSALLTALLIIGGINLARSLLAIAHASSSVSASTIVSLLISAGLLLYLWNVKSKVDLASID